MIIILYKFKTRGISFGPEMTSTNDVTIPSLVKVTLTPSPPQTSLTKIAAPECFDDFKMVIDQTLLQGTFRYLSLFEFPIVLNSLSYIPYLKTKGSKI